MTGTKENQMPREIFFVYYSVTFDELFTSKYPPPDMDKELKIMAGDVELCGNIYYIGVL